jgi:hypothetical protein
MSDNIMLSKDDREMLFVHVLVLGKAFVELAAYSSSLDEDIANQSKDICEMASMATATVCRTLGYSSEEAMKITEKVYNMKKKDNLSDLSIDDFLNTDA